MSWKSVPIGALLICGACAAPVEELPLLEHAYHASASAPQWNHRLPIDSQTVELRGDVRRHVVTGPDGNRYALRWRKVSESVGRPGDGRLLRAAKMPKKGPGFLHFGRAPFGTDETVAYLRYAAWITQKIHPGTPPIVIRDLSAEAGGALPPHKSHRTGRDADVGWFLKGNRAQRGFSDPADRLDVEKSWTFVEALLRTGAVKWIFIDRRIQEQLYRHALAQGWDRTSLERIFQYPGARRRTLIRHVRGHKNHLHVRFLCPPADDRCDP